MCQPLATQKQRVIYYTLVSGSVTVPLKANSVIASALLSPETSRVIEKAVQTANATCALYHMELALRIFCITFLCSVVLFFAYLVSFDVLAMNPRFLF